MRPKITLKIATSLDGKIALGNGESKWITGEAARARVQILRAAINGIICGVGTVLSDNPRLNLRGYPQMPDEMPARIIFDTHLKTPPDYDIVNPEIGGNSIIFHHYDALPEECKKYGDNVRLFAIGRDDYGLSISEALEILGDLQINNLMLESGGKLAASFIKQGLIDEIYWFFAPKIIGGDGIDVFASLGFEKLAEVIQLEEINSTELDGDIMRHFKVIK